MFRFRLKADCEIGEQYFQLWVRSLGDIAVEISGKILEVLPFTPFYGSSVALLLLFSINYWQLTCMPSAFLSLWCAPAYS